MLEASCKCVVVIVFDCSAGVSARLKYVTGKVDPVAIKQIRGRFAMHHLGLQFELVG